MTVLAYYDSMAGLLPCTAYAAHDDGTIALRCNVTRGSFDRGDTFVVPRHRVFPRAHFHRSRRGPFHFYTTPYSWDALLAN